jgi:hypothetical protein
MSANAFIADRVWKLPPLILHPFSDSSSPHKLLQSSRASLMLQGLLPTEELSVEQLRNVLLEGRFCEIRMLFYVGKDLVRWIDQCSDAAERESRLQSARVEWQSFAQLLVEEPPLAVREKLRAWGVADYSAIFARAIGLNCVFAEAPDQSVLSDDFIRNYHHFADQMFAAKQAERRFTRIRSADFDFELFASGEYSRILARQWQDD